MDDFEKRAKNYFTLGVIAEKLFMISESASNYFKALSAVNDFMLKKFKQRAKDHSERFSLLKIYFPELYDLTDKLFSVYRRTYTQELEKEELYLLKERVKEALEYANINIPSDKEIEEKSKDTFKR